MIQRTYVLGKRMSLSDMIQSILSEPSYQTATGRLLLVFEPCGDRGHILQLLRLTERALPGTSIIGMTTLGSVDWEAVAPTQTVCSLLLFEGSTFDVAAYDCHHMTPAEAGEDFVTSLDGSDNARGVMLVSSCASMSPAAFLYRIAAEHPSLPVFGTQAGTERYTNDRSVIFTDGKILDRAIIAITFSGEDLHISTDYNLGFKPLGKELTISPSDENGYVETIDGNDALNVYKKYLDVTPDKYFFRNVCAFPLLMRNGKRYMARVPLSYTDDGKLQFSMEVDRGSKVCLSYSKPEYLLAETLASANEMCSFAPQALMLFACYNRRIFMGNERAEREFAYYRNACPDMFWSYGYGEILRDEQGGGIVNSTIVAVGMREGGVDPSKIPAPYHDREIEGATTTYIPLANRLVTFLEATTAELRETIGELELLAESDELTATFNRRRIENILDDAIENAARPLSLVMLDIDYFKMVNDTYGHAAGDAVLRTIAQSVNRMMRDEDSLGRWGGEEFLCVLPGMDRAKATDLAERIRIRIENLHFRIVGQVTVSLGVTQVRSGEGATVAFDRVDKTLYQAKRAGRNCVRTS